MATVLHAVAESGVDQFDTELFHQQQDVVIYGRNTSGDRNVEGNGASVILRQVSSNRISTNLGLGLKQPEIKSVRVGDAVPKLPPSRKCRRQLWRYAADLFFICRLP